MNGAGLKASEFRLGGKVPRGPKLYPTLVQDIHFADRLARFVGLEARGRAVQDVGHAWVKSVSCLHCIGRCRPNRKP